MTYSNGVAGTGGDSTDTVDAEFATEAGSAGPNASDEWDGLRQVLAGDAPVTAEAEDGNDELDDDDELDEPVAVVVDALAELTERVDELAAELREERAARERLAGQLDRLAVDLDGVLGDALATERQGREQLEETLRQVQATITESHPGPERRAGEDRRSTAERRRGLPPRPLRARRVIDDVVTEPQPEPVLDADADAEDAVDEDAVDELEHSGEETNGVWKSRLNDVAGSVSSWSADDIDRLRVD